MTTFVWKNKKNKQHEKYYLFHRVWFILCLQKKYSSSYSWNEDEMQPGKEVRDLCSEPTRIQNKYEKLLYYLRDDTQHKTKNQRTILHSFFLCYPWFMYQIYEQ